VAGADRDGELIEPLWSSAVGCRRTVHGIDTNAFHGLDATDKPKIL